MANKQLNAVITIGGTITGAFKSALGTTQNKLRGIGSTIRNLEREQKRMHQTIRKAGDLGMPIYHLERQYESVTRQIERARREQERMNRAVKGMDSARGKMGAAGMALGTVGAVASVGILPVVQAAKFETAMLGVAKQVEGARDESGKLTSVYFNMAKQVQALGLELPIATNEIAEMVAAGARMGVAREELIEFTRTAGMMASAFELPAGELSDQMGKIAGLYKIPIPAIGDLADAINFLDDNAISKGGDIIEFLQRTGGAASAVKVSGKEMAALGSTLLTLGERSETASTATNALFTKLAAADKGTKKFRGALDELGLSAEGIQKGMQMDAEGTILQVLEAVNKLPQTKRLGVLVDMIGLEHSDTIAKLAGNMGEYRKQIGLVNSEAAKGSMAREFAATAETTAAQWQIAKNAMTIASVNIGAVLLPVVNQFLGVIGKGAVAVGEFAREHPVLAKNVALVAGTVLGGVAAFNAVKFAIGGVSFAFHALKLAMATNPIGLVLMALAVGAVLIYENWEPIKAFFLDLWNGIKVGAETLWNWLKGAFLNGTPIGLVIKYWEPIRGIFSNIFGKIKSVAGDAIDYVLNKIARVGDAWREVKSWFGADDGPKVPTPQPRAVPAPRRLASDWHRAAPNYTDNSSKTFNITQQPGESTDALAERIERRMQQRGRTRSGSLLFDKPRG